MTNLGGRGMSSNRRQAERLPAVGAKALLVTQRGYVGGQMVDVSETGALVAADARDLVGTRVMLRIEQPDRIWERTGIVVWFDSVRGTAIEFVSPLPPGPMSSTVN